MKRLIPLFIVAMICPSISAQNWYDALRYSETFSGGTARSTAMGGAFGALGADFYSASQNPAGLGLYRKSEFVFTPELNFIKVNSSYLGKSVDDYKYSFNFSNLGFVNAFKTGNDQGLIGGSIAFGFNRLNNFNSYTVTDGFNTESSLVDSYVDDANSAGNVGSFTPALYYDAYLIDDDTVNGGYMYNPDLLDPFIQRKTIDRSGRASEWSLSTGFNFSNMFYFGVSLGLLPLSYYETSNYAEYDGDDPDYFYFNQYEKLRVTGLGVNGKFGVIVSPLPVLRIGAAFHTPTSYKISENYDTYLTSAYVNGRVEDGLSYDYTLITPYKAIGSLSLTFGKVGILSTDVEYVGYSSMRLRNASDGYDYTYENQGIRDIYQNNINVKSGAEIRLGILYVRGGFGYYGSPYKSSEINKDAYHLNYSAGLGVREKHFFIDFAWSYLTQTEKYLMYSWRGQDYVATNEIDKMRFMTTFGFRF